MKRAYSGTARNIRRFAIIVLLGCGCSVSSDGNGEAASGQAARSGPETETKRLALLVGVNDYLANEVSEDRVSGDWVPRDLRGAVNDVEMTRKVLTTRYGFEPAGIKILTDRQATRKQLLAELRRIVNAAGPEDLVYIHFSGHGSQVQDFNGDETDDKDETLLPFDARTDGILDITDDELGAILGELRTRNAIVVLDSCHSGTGTRGGSEVEARWVKPDPRIALYERGAAEAPRGTADTLDYVLMTGAAADQSALDAPIKDRFYGLFSYALARTLGSIKLDATAQEIHARARQNVRELGAELNWVSMPEPQLEPAGRGDLLDRPLLGLVAGSTGSRLSWTEVRPSRAGEAVLMEAALIGASAGSRWAIYPPGETLFKVGGAVAVATVTALRGDDAWAALDPQSFAVRPGSRAVILTSGSTAEKVPVRLDRVQTAQRLRLERQISSNSSTIELVGPGRFARLVVDIEDGRCRVFGAGGLQEVAEFQASSDTTVVDRLEEIVARAQNVDELLTLDNHVSGLELELRAVPVRPDGSTRGIQVVAASDVPAYEIRGDSKRTRGNSLMFEVRSSADVYLTLANVDTEGAVTILFPTPHQNKDFYPDGLIPGGRWIRIPDSITRDNRAGFYWDASEPPGQDTTRVFAATDRVVAEQIRSYVASFGAAATRGAGGLKELSRQLANVAARGVTVAPSGDRPDDPIETGSRPGTAVDWTAESITFVVERQPETR